MNRIMFKNLSNFSNLFQNKLFIAKVPGFSSKTPFSIRPVSSSSNNGGQVPRAAFQRQFQQQFTAQQKEKMRLNKLNTMLYSASFLITFLGLSYVAVPLYRLLCKRTGFGGVPNTEIKVRTSDDFRRIDGHRPLKITFSSQVSHQLNWKFVPEHPFIKVVPGETALAFYKAYNNAEKPLVGVATYNIIPDKAAAYFNKIQCFCFDEQLLDPKEEIDMPVFFFIDPSFADDPLMDDVNEIMLSYTFFKTTDSLIHQT